MTDDKQAEEGEFLNCSFCGKSQHEVRKLIAGPSVFICDECVELCKDILREEPRDQEKVDTSSDKGAEANDGLHNNNDLSEVIKQAKDGELLNCSFCSKSKHEVRKLIASRQSWPAAFAASGKSQHEVKNLIEGPYVFICDECVELCEDILREEPQQEFQTSIEKGAEAKRSDGLDSNDLSTIISSIRDVLAHIRSVQFLTVTLSASAFLLSLFAVPGAPDLVRELEEFSRIQDTREYVTVLRKIFAPQIEQTLSRRSSDRLVKQIGSQRLRLWTDPTHVARFAHLTVKEIVDTLSTINVGAEMIDRISVEPSEESR